MLAFCAPPPPPGEGVCLASSPSIPGRLGEVRGRRRGEGSRKNREEIGAHKGWIGVHFLKASSVYDLDGISSVRPS